MKKILQILLYSTSLFIFTTSCTTVEYNKTDEAMGFSPAKCEICTGPCDCNNRFETDQKYNLHEDKKK